MRYKIENVFESVKNGHFLSIFITSSFLYLIFKSPVSFFREAAQSRLRLLYQLIVSLSSERAEISVEGIVGKFALGVRLEVMSINSVE